jgi:quinol monooxygenase YgiN
MLEKDRNETKCLIVFSMRLLSSDESLLTIRRALNSLLGPTKATPGCIDARLYACQTQSNVLFFVEEWTTSAEFEANLDTIKLQGTSNNDDFVVGDFAAVA